MVQKSNLDINKEIKSTFKNQYGRMPNAAELKFLSLYIKENFENIVDEAIAYGKQVNFKRLA